VLELHRQAGLVDEHAHKVGVIGVLLVDDLDREPVPRLATFGRGKVDLRHAPDCNLTD